MDWSHIIERQLIHFFAAPGAFLIAFHLTEFFFGRWYPAWTRLFWLRLIIPAVFVEFAIFFREPYDVGVLANWWGKSYIDFTFWTLGLAVGGVWGFYRAVKRFNVEAVRR